MSSYVKEAVELFREADSRMSAYVSMIDNAQRHIRSNLENNIALPEGVRVALINPDSRSFLLGALRDLEQDKSGAQKSVARLRGMLGRAEVLEAKRMVSGWSNGMDAAMETVINHAYQDSDILPPPPHYFSEINSQIFSVFPYLSDDPRRDQQIYQITNHLLTVENPWSRYADIVQ